jgi:Nrap protein domain 1
MLTRLVKIADASKSLQKAHKIVVPFPDPKPDQNAAYKVAYRKPSKINIVGSYALKTMIKSDDVLSVDMVVTMPASIFQEKDFLNYRYFYKRAYYLACIAAGLQGTSPEVFTLKFENLNGNSLHPILVARLKSSMSPISPRFGLTNIIFKKSQTQAHSSTFASFPVPRKTYFLNQNCDPQRIQSDQNRGWRMKLLLQRRLLSTTPPCNLTAITSHISSSSIPARNKQVGSRQPVFSVEYGFAKEGLEVLFQTEGLVTLNGLLYQLCY